MRPQPGTEPGIQHIRILLDILRAAVAGSRVFNADDHFPAVPAIPDRNTVSPPELAADAPVTDIFHPVEIDLGKTLRDDFDAAVL